MKTTIKALLGVSLVLGMQATAQAATQWNRLVWDSDPAHNATIGFSPQGESINPYVVYGLDTNEDNWTQVEVTDSHTFQVGLKSHFVRLTGLPENSPVYYRVCDQDGCGQRFWFQTAPTDNSPFVMVAGGDTRSGWGNRKAGNRLIAKIRPLFIMHGGDYTNLNLFVDMGTYLGDWEYTFSDDVIDGVAYKRIYPFIPTHGNHEDNDYATLCKVFGVDYNQDGECNKFDTYGAFNISPLLRVYTLNSQYKNSGYASYAAAMNDWLYNDLETQGGSALWRFAQYHKPMFPHYSGKAENQELFDWWSEAFYNNAMNLVVESDTHINKLTKAIKPSGDVFTSVTDGGTVYVGEGSWGAPSRSANKPQDWTIDLASIQQFKVIQVTADQVTVGTAQFDDTAATLSREERLANTLVLPEGINWWFANGVGDEVRLSRAANQLSVIDNGGSGDGAKVISLALTDDAFVASKKADQNFDGSNEGLLVDGFDLSNGKMFSLLKFDIASLPACIDTDSVVLAMDVRDEAPATYEIYKATRDWQEETVTWNSATDIAGELLTTFRPNSTGNVEANLSASGVLQDWMQNGNYGLVIKTSAIDGLDFESKETGNGAVLKLSYDDQAACTGTDIVEVANQALTKDTFTTKGVEEVVLAFTMTSQTADAQLQKITLAAGGDYDETKLASVGLYVDENKNGVADAGELQARGAYANDNGQLVFTLNVPYTLSVGETSLLVTYKF